MIEQEILLSNPFPGLRPFETDENFLFFGRDGQSEEVLNRLRESRFVAVVGTSGSGKSSLVRAGVLPALYSGHMTSAGSSWRVAVFRPGNDPVGNLARALNALDVFGAAGEDADLRLANTETTLRRSSLGLTEIVSQARMAPHENLLLLADQFEELFRFRRVAAGPDAEDEAAALVKLLLEAARQRALPIYVILTMRSDYLGETARFRGLPEAINEGQYLIPRMTDDGRREAITGPVAIAGASITAPLVNRLLNDAGDDPAQLPILQHALMRTWVYWKSHARPADPLDITHYEAVGGMAKALSRHADEAYEELFDPMQEYGGPLQGVAEKLFRCLTEKGPDGSGVRRPATVREICQVAGAGFDEVEAVVKSFRREGRSFLMPPPSVPLDEDTLIDISHESLISGWQRLRDWAEEEARSARTYRRLADTAVLREHGDAGLWRDPDLQVALKWREEAKPNEAWARRYHPEFGKAMAFLEESLADRERDAQERERQIERELKQAQALAAEQRRRVRLQRLGLLILSALLLLLLGLTAFAFQQRSSALKQKAFAQTQTTVANRALEEAQKATAEAARQRDIARGELEGRIQAEKAKEEADEARHETEAQLAKTLKEAAARAQADAEKQRVIAAQARASEADALRQRNIAGRALDEVKKQQGEVEKERDAANAALATAETEKNRAKEALNTIREIDMSAPYFHAIMRGHRGEIKYAAYSPDGRKVVTFGEDGWRPWDANTGLIKSWFGTGAGSRTDSQGFPAFSPDGQRLAVGGHDPGGRVLDTETGFKLFDLESKRDVPIYSPDGRLILSFGDESCDILDAQTGKKLAELEEHFVADVLPSFSPDGRFIITDDGAGKGTAYIWNASTGKKVMALSGHTERLSGVAFSHDGRRVVTASEDGTARVWDARTGETVINLVGHEKAVTSAVFSSDDKYVVTAGEDGTARVWDAHKVKPVVVGTGPRGERVEDQGVVVTTLTGHEGAVKRAIFSPDDRWVVTIGEDKTARVWQATKEERGVKPGEVLAVLSGHIGPLTWVDFSPGKEGKFLVTTSEDKTARVWDLTGLNNLSGLDAALTAENSKYEGECPATIKFSGYVAAAGGSGKVKYRFVYSDGRPSDVKELTLDHPGRKDISKTLTFDASSKSSAGEWVAVEILEPEKKEFGRAYFTVKCLNQSQNQGAVALVTGQVLAQVMPNLLAARRAQYLPYLQQAMAEFDINTPARQAAFLAQIAHESAELRFLEDLGSGDAYEGRKDLGNIYPGDGKQFKGRGVIMIYGRANYQRYGQLLGLDLVGHPELAATPEVAFRLAGLFWKSSGLNELADQQQFKAITKRISGGYNGLEDRLSYYERAKRALGVSGAPETQP